MNVNIVRSDVTDFRLLRSTKEKPKPFDALRPDQSRSLCHDTSVGTATGQEGFGGALKACNFGPLTAGSDVQVVKEIWNRERRKACRVVDPSQFR